MAEQVEQAEQIEIPESMTEHEAAELMAKANLFGDREAPKPERRMPAKDPVTGKFVKAQPEGEAEPTAETEPDAEPEAEAEPEPDAEPEGEAEETPAERTLRIKLDGMEQELPESEVTKGYLRQADYTKKTQALAEDRKRFESEIAAPLREERVYYTERLAALEEALTALAPAQEPDWESASATMTPEEFTKHYAAWKANRARVERVQAEQARVRELHERETMRERAARIKEQQGLLEAAIPDLKDPEKGKMLREDLVAYAKSLQFTDDDLDGIDDHRALVILHKARLWDESQKRRPKVEEKVQRAVDGLKPSGARPAPRAKAVEQARARLAKTGSVEDAAEAMRAAKLFG